MNDTPILAQFKTRQLTFKKVRDSYREKEKKLQDEFNSKKIDYPPGGIFLRAFKEERKLEVWIKGVNSDTFSFFKEYEFSGFSGGYGPKRKEGDGQIPEGFYYISVFNPNSNFYLSLKVSYPNESDRILGNKSNLGGDIFIHGSNVTIGCIPITDDKIKELYILAVEAAENGQSKIPVHIFPAKLTAGKLSSLSEKYMQFSIFWKKLKTGYDFFEENKKIPPIDVNTKSGEYSIGNYK